MIKHILLLLPAVYKSNVKIFFFILFGLIMLINSYPQEIERLNCDSLFSEFEVIEPKYHWVTKTTELIDNMDSILFSFYKKVESLINKPDENNFLLIGAMIDTSGNVLCTKVYRGVNDIVDSLALKEVKEFRFTPAEVRGKKVQMPSMLLLLSEKIIKKFKQENQK